MIDSHGDTTALVKAAGRRRRRTAAARLQHRPDDRGPPGADLAVRRGPGRRARRSRAWSSTTTRATSWTTTCERSITWTRTGCGSTRDVTVTIRLTNTAPAGLPPVHRGTQRPPELSHQPRRQPARRLLLRHHRGLPCSPPTWTASSPRWLRAGAGHPVYGVDVELPRGATRTLVFHMKEPAGAGAPIVLRQPLVRPRAGDDPQPVLRQLTDPGSEPDEGDDQGDEDESDAGAHHDERDLPARGVADPSP